MTERKIGSLDSQITPTFFNSPKFDVHAIDRIV